MHRPIEEIRESIEFCKREIKNTEEKIMFKDNYCKQISNDPKYPPLSRGAMISGLRQEIEQHQNLIESCCESIEKYTIELNTHPEIRYKNEAVKEQEYIWFKSAMAQAATDEQYRELAHNFQFFKGYKDTTVLAEICEEKADDIALIKIQEANEAAQRRREAAQKRKRTQKVIAIISAIVVLLSIAGVFLLKIFQVWTEDRNYYFVGELSDGLAVFEIGPSANRKLGFVNEAGEEIIPAVYTSANSFSEGMAAVARTDKWGYIDKNGNEIIQLIFDSAMEFSEGLAAVSINRKWGYINQQGSFIIPAQYDSAGHFLSGYAVVGTSDNNTGSRKTVSGIIDNNGTTIIPLQYSQISIVGEEHAAAELDGKYGLIEIRTSEEALPFQYHGISGVDGDLVIVEGLTGSNNNVSVRGAVRMITGEVVVPVNYGSITFDDDEIVAKVWGSSETHRYSRMGSRLD